jgi:Bacterial Ig-like domain (group 2)
VRLRHTIHIICLAAVTFLLLHCGTSHDLLSLSVSPATASMSAAGQTIQFKAVGTDVRVSETPRTPATTDWTHRVTWSSSDSAVATIDSSGLATGVGPGTTTITASASGMSATATLTLSTPGQSQGILSSITVIPSSQTLIATGDSAQYIAIGTFSTAPTTQDMTGQVKWVSSDVNVATIGSTGIAVATGPGQATITALARASNGAAVTGTATLSSCAAGSPGCTVVNNLPALSVYGVGQGAGTVTSNPPGINCNPSSGSVSGCTAYFPSGTAVQLTASPTGFGGWSANCTPSTSATCTVSMSINQTVGAIFN